MELAAAKARCEAIPRGAQPQLFYDLGREGIVTVGPGSLQDVKHVDICIYVQRGGTAPYPPDHFAYLEDLAHKRGTGSEDFCRLMEGFERVYSGESPMTVADDLGAIAFPGERLSTRLFLVLAQLFMVEQEINYAPGRRKTYYSPPRRFHAEYVRWVASGTTPIEQILARNRSRRMPDAHPRAYACPHAAGP